MSHNCKALYHTFGCKLNFAETASVERLFNNRGITTVTKGDVPDFIVINSCSVTAEADRKCRSFIRSLCRCYAQLKPDELAALPGVALVAGVNSKLRLIDYVDSFSMDTIVEPDFKEAKDLRDFMPSCSRGDRTRYFLKVQDGCDYWCTYCTIPKARGRSRSGSIADIVAQASLAAEEGGKEIVITGVNIGDFGKGRDESFLDLCRALDKVDGIERYRISSIEPNLLTDEVIDFVASSRSFMPHFHIPLQSGSDKVLALMRRRYDTALYAAKIDRVRRVLPDAFIGIDFIVGARGESDTLFEESRSFVDSLPVSHVHVFPYSERPGTRALEIEGVVEQAEKHRRVAVMTALSAEKHAAFARNFLGTTRPVLLEHPKKGMPMGGFTDNYLRIEADVDPANDNTVRNMVLDTLCDDGETIKARLAD